MLQVTETAIKEVKILEYNGWDDVRGLAYTTYSRKALLNAGIDIEFTEVNTYAPINAGTLYGIHFQNNPRPQTKLLYCTLGRGMDYAVDLRKESPTYLKWVGVELSKENRRQIAWNDPDIGIEYLITHPILAQHDIIAPKLKDSDCNL